MVDDVEWDETEGDGPFPGFGGEEGGVCVVGEAGDDDEEDDLDCEVDECCEGAGSGTGDLVGCGGGLVGGVENDGGGEVIELVLVWWGVHLLYHTGFWLCL